jgi:hypothetical protein
VGAIIRLQGKEYTTHAGLLMVAHEHGLSSVEVDLVNYDAESGEAIIKATASGERGTFTDYGDASPKNVGKLIVNATIRMASTRAISRALRLYLGVGMTCLEELPGKSKEAGAEEEEAGKNGKHPSWGAARNTFMQAIKEPTVDLGYEFVAWMCQKLDRPRPSQMDDDQRARLISWLRADETQVRIQKFLEEYRVVRLGGAK